MSRDDAALLNLVGRHLLAVEDVAELIDVLDLLMERLGARSVLLVTLATARNEPLRFAVGDIEMGPVLDALVMRVRDSRQPVIVPSVEAWLLEAGLAGLSRGGSGVAVPIQGQAGTVIGVLTVTHTQENAVGGSHVALLTAVGYQMAAALVQTRLAAKVRRGAYELSLLDEIGQAFSSLNLEQLLRMILARASRTLRVNRSVLFMFDEERQDLVLQAVDHPGASDEVLGLRVSLDERPHIADAIRARRWVEVPNIYADPRWRGFWLRAQEMGLEAALAVPLIVKGKAIGAISLDRTAARPPFTPDEISLCQIIANQAASAIENARLYGETRRYAYEVRLRAAEVDQRAQRLALLNRISTALVTSLDISRIAPTLAAEIAQALDLPRSGLFVLDADGVSGQIVAVYPPGDPACDLPIPVTFADTSFIETLSKADAPLLIEKAQVYAPLEPVRSLLRTFDIRSVLIVPMTVAGQVLGVIGLDVTDCPPLSADDMELAMTVGNQVAFVLTNAQLYAATEHRAAENARLYREAQRRADQLRLINEVSQEIGSILDTDLLLWSVVRLIRETLDCYHVAIALVEGDELAFKADVGYPHEEACLMNLRLQLAGKGLTAWVAQHGEPLLVTDVAKEPRSLPIRELGETQSEVTVPLKLGSRVIGVLDAQNASVDGFDESDLSLLQSLAAQVAVALENARLFGVVQSERAKLAAVITDAGDVVLVTDERDRVLLMNRAAERAFRVTARDVVGQPLLQHIANPGVQRLWQASAEATSYPLTEEIGLDDGRTLYANLTAVPQVGLVAVMQDISHLKELDRMKSEFVSTVSHDLRSPLQAVRINLEMLPRMGRLNAEQREAITSSLRVLDRVSALVRDLLDLGRIEAGVGLERALCSLGRIIDITVEDMLPRARIQGLHLTTQVPDDLPYVYGDEGRLAQVVANLVDNAIKYTPMRGRIQVVACQVDDAVLVEVRDNGPGIAAENLARLFEKFYRVPDARGQRPEGLGLGLAIVKSIVEAHGGRVWVESCTDPARHGSTFGFAIPVEMRNKK